MITIKSDEMHFLCWSYKLLFLCNRISVHCAEREVKKVFFFRVSNSDCTVYSSRQALFWSMQMNKRPSDEDFHNIKAKCEWRWLRRQKEKRKTLAHTNVAVWWCNKDYLYARIKIRVIIRKSSLLKAMCFLELVFVLRFYMRWMEDDGKNLWCMKMKCE